MVSEYRREIRERKARVFGLCVGLALLTVLPAFGCQPARQTKPVENVSGDPYAEALAFATAIMSYVGANGRLPESKEALQDFCRTASLSCVNLDWTRVLWQRLERDTLTVHYTSSQGITIPITVTTDPTSLRVGDRTMMEELQKKLHESMKP
jgi:hypothetical protein